jgi:hypothetical protein
MATSKPTQTMLNLISAIENTRDLKKLCEYHKKYCGSAPAILTKSYLRRKIIYRIQEIQFGGLTEDEIKRIEALANEPKDKTPTMNIVKGTIIKREYNNQLYEVVSLGNGKFEMNGIEYNSLSAVAKKITGSHWNGRAFFGL